MKKICIPKKSGGTRTIYVPSDEEMRSFRDLLPTVAEAQAAQCDPRVVHGFTAGRSPVTNALAHAGRRYTLCADLQDFFDSVTARHLRGRVPAMVIARCLVDGAARQGLPTSPSLANIAAADMDRAILRAAAKAGHDIVYTRYADDISVSADTEEAIQWARRALPAIVGRCGFGLNAAKTRVMDARYQRRIITGVALTEDGRAVPTRRMRRRLRAAEHRARNDGGDWVRMASGLREWCAMRTPKPLQQPAQARQEQPADMRLISHLCRHWGLRIPTVVLPKCEDVLREDLIITPDPAYILGPSQWGTSWTSCMRHRAPVQRFHEGTVLWLCLRGTRMAALLSPRTRLDGVTRRQIRARCLVHELRDGRQCYDRIYGESKEAMQQLAEALRDAGYAPARECAGGTVVGHVPVSYVPVLPYLDTTVARRARARSGRHAGRTVYVIHVRG